MVKAKLDASGVPVMFIGLSRANIERLLQGFPIMAELQWWDMGPGECLIQFGETEQSIKNTLMMSTISAVKDEH